MTTDVLFAPANDGKILPVIDVTNPAFHVTPAEDELRAMTEQFVRDQQHQQELSPAMLEALRSSSLGKAMLAAAGSYLSGLATYQLKQGPSNLGANASLIDRALVSSFPAFAARIRLQDMAHLLAEALAPIVVNQPQRPLCLLNIAGGPCADSWNALLVLRELHPQLLAACNITIAALDIDEAGPAFGQRALARLLEPGAPLAAMQVRLEPIKYRWDEANRLSELLHQRLVSGTTCAVSSEGGLFEYATDAVVVANLAAVHAGTARDAVVVGSVTRKCAAQDAMQRNNLATTRPRTLDEFRALAHQAGWKIDHSIERSFTFSVRLVKQ